MRRQFGTMFIAFACTWWLLKEPIEKRITEVAPSFCHALTPKPFAFRQTWTSESFSIWSDPVFLLRVQPATCLQKKKKKKAPQTVICHSLHVSGLSLWLRTVQIKFLFATKWNHHALCVSYYPKPRVTKEWNRASVSIRPFMHGGSAMCSDCRWHLKGHWFLKTSW